MSEQELPQECCAKCRFARGESVDSVAFHCHRYPPYFPASISVVPDIRYGRKSIHADANDGVSQALFPGVYDDDWCGEFQPRQPDKPA